GGAKSLAAARGWLVEVRKRRPNWGRAYVLEGFLDESEQNVEKAVRNYRAALDRGESNPELIARLVKLLNSQRNYGDALAVLSQIKQPGCSAERSRLATLTALLNGEQNQLALKGASEKLSADSKDPLDHLLRGRLLWAAKKNDEAEAALRRAVELGPRRP